MAVTALGRQARARRGAQRTGAIFLLTAAMALGGPGAGVSPAGAGGASTVTALVATHSNLLLDVRGASVAPGADTIQWSYNGGDNQRWAALPFSSVAGFDVVIIQSVGSGLVLDVAGGLTVNGAKIVQQPWSGAISQLWMTLPLNNDSSFYVIVNLNSGRVLDVAGASVGEGAPVIQWNWHGALNQIWSKTIFTET